MGGDGAVCVAMQLSNQEFLDSSVIVGVMHSPDCTSSFICFSYCTVTPSVLFIVYVSVRAFGHTVNN